MIRIRATAGGATPEQLIRVASLAREYGKPVIHMTTRQEMQLHDAKLDDAPMIMRALAKVGLSCRGGGGNTMRNVMASFDSGINPSEVFDVTPHAIALSSHLLSDSDSWNLPRKFKICFSNSAQDHTLAVFNDLGFIARISHAQRGFQVWAAGGMGCRPRIGRVLHDFIPEEKVLHVYSAIKQLFYHHGNRKNKNSNRLRFLWDELGEDQFLGIYHREFDRLESGSETGLELKEVENFGNVKNLTPVAISSTRFDTWKRRFVSTQKQPGLTSIDIPLNRGDISADDAVTLGSLLTSFGSNVLRFTTRQNIQLRNIPQEYLGHIFNTVSQLDTLSASPGIIGNLVSCKGAKTCAAGICFSQEAAQAIQQNLIQADSALELPDDLNINISGCPNACGQHHAADLGFSGKVARKSGRTFPAYWIYGGASPDSTAPHYAEKTSWIPAKAIPSAVQDILEKYSGKKSQYPRFGDYFLNGGRKDIIKLCEKYQREMPSFAENSDYYTDWGADEPFSTVQLAHGECSAGVYDMIEVEMDAIQSNQQKVSALKIGDALQTALWDIVYSAASMLLITRGVDPGTEDEAFAEYITYFFDTGLISDSYRGLVVAAQGRNLKALEQQKEKVCELGDLMIRLYHKMDNSMRFPGEHEIGSITTVESQTPVPSVVENKQFDRARDLRGVACPMNFVKTKVELAGMSSEQVLEILLDDGEPIDNVPRSVISEGHTILSQEKTDNYWTVVIRKV